MLAPACTPGPARTSVRPTAVSERNRRSRDRINAERLTRDALIARADYLPSEDRILLLAYFVHGVPLDELASIRRSTKRQLRRRLQSMRDTLADPSFLLAVRFAKRLPGDLPALARGRWIENIPLRTLAQQHHKSLHHVRQQLDQARSLLTFFAENR